jgi:hypothetical protein
MKDTTNTSSKIEKSEQKKQYVRPQLVTHGAVESLTQGTQGGPSGGGIYNQL